MAESGTVAPGTIIVLNGEPRAGKSSIAAAILESFEGTWMNVGVDLVGQAIAKRLWPGIGLRPGGERPDLEPEIGKLYAGLYEAVAALSRQGICVAVDVGHHDHYSTPLGILPDCAARLDGLPAWLIGVRCPVEEIMRRRDAGHIGREGMYATSMPDGSVPEPVTRWVAVHRPGIYDLEVDTSVMNPEECAAAVRARVEDGTPPSAFRSLAAMRGQFQR